MTERTLTAVSRLTAWLRDYGRDRSPEFQDDLAIVLKEVRDWNRRCPTCDICGRPRLTLEQDWCVGHMTTFTVANISEIKPFEPIVEPFLQGEITVATP